MPTPLAHSFCGFLLFRDTKKHLFKNLTYAASFTVFFSTLPDYDYLLGLIKGDLMWGHRMVTHTLLFPLITGALIGLGAVFSRRRFLPFFGLSTGLLGIHILLDYLSYDFNPDNGVGIPLLRPFMAGFFNFPFHPVAPRLIGDPPRLIGILVNDFYYMGIFGAIMFWRAKRKAMKGRSATCASAL